MNIKNIAEHAASAVGCSPSTAHDILLTIPEILSSLPKGVKSVTWYGFGKFIISERPARRCMNYLKNEMIHVPKKRKIKFRPSITFKQKLN